MDLKNILTTFTFNAHFVVSNIKRRNFDFWTHQLIPNNCKYLNSSYFCCQQWALHFILC